MTQQTAQNMTGKTGGKTMITGKRLLVFTVAAAVLGAGAFILTASRSSLAEAPSVQHQSVAVEVSPVTVSDVFTIALGVGNVGAMRDVSVASETAGRVLKVRVNVGDVVKQGQTLVEVDAELKEAAAEQARAQMLAAKTNLEKSRKDYERTEKLFASGDVADIELEGYRLGYQAADAQYKGALAALRVAERQLGDSRIKSPIPGIVASRKVEMGEMVAPGMEIANIVDISSLKVRLSVAEEDIARLQDGQPATLRIDSRPGESFLGKVLTIGAKSESPNGHTYPVEVIMQNNRKHPLKVGMFARVEIQTGFVRGVPVISKESIVEDGSRPAVFVVKDGIARLRPVTLGLRGETTIQVVNGLAEGDLVVSFGQKALKDGTPVQYK